MRCVCSRAREYWEGPFHEFRQCHGRTENDSNESAPFAFLSCSAFVPSLWVCGWFEQLGWATPSFEPDAVEGDGVGDDMNSWAYDGNRVKVRSLMCNSNDIIIII
jgi:hypothetical protein